MWCLKLLDIIFIMLNNVEIAGIPLSWIDGSRRASEFISIVLWRSCYQETDTAILEVTCIDQNKYRRCCSLADCN